MAEEKKEPTTVETAKESGTETVSQEVVSRGPFSLGRDAIKVLIISQIVTVLLVFAVFFALSGTFQNKIDSVVRDEEARAEKVVETFRSYNGFLSSREKLRDLVEGVSIDRISEKNGKEILELDNKITDLLKGPYISRLAVYPHDREDYIARAVASFLNVELNQALTFIDKVIEMNPSDALSHYNKGIVFSLLKMHRKAIESFDRAIDLKKGFAVAWNAKGTAYRNLNRKTESLAAYKKASELDPKSSDIWFNMGVAYSQFNHHDEAIKAYRLALKNNPKFSLAWYNIACKYSQRQEKENTLFYLKKALSMDPSLREAARNDVDFEWLFDDPDFSETTR